MYRSLSTYFLLMPTWATFGLPQIDTIACFESSTQHTLDNNAKIWNYCYNAGWYIQHTKLSCFMQGKQGVYEAI